MQVTAPPEGPAPGDELKVYLEPMAGSGPYHRVEDWADDKLDPTNNTATLPLQQR